MQRLEIFSRSRGLTAAVVLSSFLASMAVGAEPVALRVESFTVAPSSQPVAYVQIHNLEKNAYQGTVSLAGPDGWRITPTSRDVSLAPGETQRVAFDVSDGVSLQANRYPMTARATGGGTTVVKQQQVVTASAPYFKPTIDGDPGDWADAIPVTFETKGKNTEIRTFWSSRRVSLLVSVEEDHLAGYSGAPGEPFDAVQLALSPEGAVTGASTDGEAARYEFLLVATADGARCYQLAAPGTPLAETAKARPLAPLICEDAELAVHREGTTTYYEVGLSMRSMRDRLRPSEGRAFCLSLLVHDPDGSGIRDWGRAAGLWPRERNRLAWSSFAGAHWGQEPPYDNKTPWGMCSSKY